MISGLRILAQAARSELASRMAYRTDFFVSLGMILLNQLVVPLVTLLMYRAGAAFPGWTLYEALLIQGVFLLARGTASSLFFGLVWNTLGRVRDGTFDLLLTKPRSTLFMAIVTALDSDSLGRVLGGVVTTAVALAHLPAPGPRQWIEFLLLLILSLGMLFAAALFLSGIVFKWVGNSRVYEIFESVTAFGRYPRSIFPRPLQVIISIAMPVAMIAFFPASALLGRPVEDAAWAAAACLLLMGAGLVFWHWMLRRYTSAGG